MKTLIKSSLHLIYDVVRCKSAALFCIVTFSVTLNLRLKLHPAELPQTADHVLRWFYTVQTLSKSSTMIHIKEIQTNSLLLT